MPALPSDGYLIPADPSALATATTAHAPPAYHASTHWRNRALRARYAAGTHHAIIRSLASGSDTSDPVALSLPPRLRKGRLQLVKRNVAARSDALDIADEDEDGSTAGRTRGRNEVFNIGALPHLDVDAEIGTWGGAVENYASAGLGGKAIFDAADEVTGLQKAVLDVQIDFAEGSALTGTAAAARGMGPASRRDTLGTITAYVVDRQKLRESGYQFAHGADDNVGELMSHLFTETGGFRFGKAGKKRVRFLVIESIILEPCLDRSGLHLLLALHLASNPSGPAFDALILNTAKHGQSPSSPFGFTCRWPKNALIPSSLSGTAHGRAQAMSTAVPFQGQYWGRIGLKAWFLSPTQSIRGAPRVWGMCLDQMDGRYAVRKVVPHFFAREMTAEQEDKGNDPHMASGTTEGPMTPITSRNAIKIRPEPDYHPAGSVDSPAPAYDLHDRVKAACGGLGPLRQALANSAHANQQARTGPQQANSAPKGNEVLAKALGLYVEPIVQEPPKVENTVRIGRPDNGDSQTALKPTRRRAGVTGDKENEAPAKPKLKKQVAFAPNAQLRIYRNVPNASRPNTSSSLRDSGLPTLGSCTVLESSMLDRPYARGRLDEHAPRATTQATVSESGSNPDVHIARDADAYANAIDRYLCAVRTGTLSRGERSALLQGIVSTGRMSDAWAEAARAASVAAASAVWPRRLLFPD